MQRESDSVPRRVLHDAVTAVALGLIKRGVGANAPLETAGYQK
jgi:hypothetical protein